MLTEHFDHYFELLPVRDAETRHEVFRLRYAVYCQELGYEDPAAFPDGMERDEFDAGSSAYALLRHRDSRALVGCVRLILDVQGDADFRFPFERVCAGKLDTVALGLTTAGRARSGEISRLAIHEAFRRRAGEWHTAEGGQPPVDGAPQERRKPLLPMSLFLAATALAMNRGLDQVFVMMEPRLARLLGRSGVRFTQVGDIVDHHGQRGPFRITRPELESSLPPDAAALVQAMQTRLG